MDERTVLEISLWVFTAGFANKGLTFLRLALVMRGQRDKTRLGKALLWHYTALASQATALSFIFLYYATQVRGFDDWLSVKSRIVMYLIATVLVAWASIMGNRLTLAYGDATSTETQEKPSYSESTNERQDIREVKQNDHEVLQLEIAQRQIATGNLQDARETLQAVERERQITQAQELDDRQDAADTREGLADTRQEEQDERDTCKEETT